MANLADELGDAWGSDDEDDDGDRFAEEIDDGDVANTSYQDEGAIDYSLHAQSANGVSVTGLTNGVHDTSADDINPAKEGGSVGSAGSPNAKSKRHSGRRRTNTTLSGPDGTIGTIAEINGDFAGEYGYNDNEDETFSFKLDARLAEVHELAETGTALVGEEGGAVVRRMIGRLQELGSQSGMDGAVTW